MPSLRKIPPPETEFLDPRTGRISRLWYQYLFNLNSDTTTISTTVTTAAGINVPGEFGTGEDGEPGPPGMPGRDGRDGVTTVVHVREDADAEDGMRGPPGRDGADGVTTFIHIYDDPPEPEPYFMRIP